MKVKAHSGWHGNERAEAAATKIAHANLQLTTLDAPHYCQAGHGPTWLKTPNPASTDGLFITQPEPTAVQRVDIAADMPLCGGRSFGQVGSLYTRHAILACVYHRENQIIFVCSILRCAGARQK